MTNRTTLLGVLLVGCLAVATPLAAAGPGDTVDTFQGNETMNGSDSMTGMTTTDSMGDGMTTTESMDDSMATTDSMDDDETTEMTNGTDGGDTGTLAVAAVGGAVIVGAVGLGLRRRGEQ